jgi:hypothetical protein
MCNAMLHFQDAVFVLPVMGIQGNKDPMADVYSIDH